MSLTKPRLWIVGTAVLSVLLTVAAYFVLIGPKRAEAADLRQQVSDTQSQNLTLAGRVEQLKVQFAELPQRQAELATIKQAMPEDAALPTLIRELDSRAASAGVTLMTVAPGEPAAFVDPAATAVAPVPAEGEGEATATPAPAVASDLLVSIPVSVTVIGDFFESELFLKSLQTEMPRAFLVQTLSMAAEPAAEATGGKPATVNGDVATTITGSVFVLRSASAPQAQTAVPDASSIATN